jgi:hypothetical protein
LGLAYDLSIRMALRLAHETWHARPVTHPALTGARHPAVLGQITPGHNYAYLVRRTWCAGFVPD